MNDIEEPDFEDFFTGAMLILQRVTGVDPETLWKESAGSGNETESSAQPPRGADVGIDGNRPPRTVDAAPNDSVPVASAAEQIGDRPGGSFVRPGHIDELKSEAIDKILHYATDPSMKPETLLDNLLSVQTGWLVHMPNNAAFIKTACQTAARVIRGEITVEAAKKYLTTL